MIEEDKPILWYIGNASGRLIGPITEDEVRRQLETGEISWVDFALVTPIKKWIRICELSKCKHWMPDSPSELLLPELKRERTATLNMKIPEDAPHSLSPGKSLWYLQYGGSRFGPMTIHEAQSIVKSGKLEGKIYAWKPGMTQWIHQKELEEFHEEPPKIEAPRDATNQRRAPRFPFVATVLYHPCEKPAEPGAEGPVGICRDISQFGLLILSDMLPEKTGTEFDLEITPGGINAPPSLKIKAGVVRLLQGEKGFAVIFSNPDAEQKKTIQLYINRAKASSAVHEHK